MGHRLGSPLPGGSRALHWVAFPCQLQKILRSQLWAPLFPSARGVMHAGAGARRPGWQLPAGHLPKDERCQAPSRFQLSTSWCGRLLQDGQQHQADPGESMVGEDNQHALLWGSRAKRLLPVAKHKALLSWM